MSAEIVEAVKALGREKGISEEKLMGALEDALLSAYKKQPGAARYARVRMDRDSGDFIVEEFLLPPDLEVVRIVDIAGLDTQADAGTHVASTRQIGGLEIVKIENKGKGFRRLRVRVVPAAS